MRSLSSSVLFTTIFPFADATETPPVHVSISSSPLPAQQRLVHHGYMGHESQRESSTINCHRKRHDEALTNALVTLTTFTCSHRQKYHMCMKPRPALTHLTEAQASNLLPWRPMERHCRTFA